jgi:membrane protein DedA with SNARE-associated domain
VLVGRCVPVVRSLVSVPAGVERMPPWRFTLYTLAGSAVWNGALLMGGYLLGSQWQSIGEYSDYLNYAVYALIAFFVVRFVVTRRRRRRAS